MSDDFRNRQDKGMKDFSLSNTHGANFGKYFEMPGILRI